VTWVMWNLISVRLEIVLVMVQDRCTVCENVPLAQKIILDTSDGTPWSRGSTRRSFRSSLR
jgi:hypothetical protein